MKKLMLTLFSLGCAGLLNAQVPDSARAVRKPSGYRTDSVRSGSQTFQGGGNSSQKRSQGDTLSARKTKSKSSNTRTP